MSLVRYNTDDNLTLPTSDIMSDDDFDDDDTVPSVPSGSVTVSSSSPGIGLCDSPKVRPCSLALDTSTTMPQGPSNDESWGQMYVACLLQCYSVTSSSCTAAGTLC
jgi:hypothetical protein